VSTKPGELQLRPILLRCRARDWNSLHREPTDALWPELGLPARISLGSARLS
jgi:hypothetical protein